MMTRWRSEPIRFSQIVSVYHSGRLRYKIENLPSHSFLEIVQPPQHQYRHLGWSLIGDKYLEQDSKNWQIHLHWVKRQLIDRIQSLQNKNAKIFFISNLFSPRILTVAMTKSLARSFRRTSLYSYLIIALKFCIIYSISDIQAFETRPRSRSFRIVPLIKGQIKSIILNGIDMLDERSW